MANAPINCDVCHTIIPASVLHWYHVRLDAHIHVMGCSFSSVKGEDVSAHAMMLTTVDDLVSKYGVSQTLKPVMHKVCILSPSGYRAIVGTIVSRRPSTADGFTEVITMQCEDGLRHCYLRDGDYVEAFDPDAKPRWRR